MPAGRAAAPGHRDVWGRLANAVMRHPVRYLAGVVLVLADSDVRVMAARVAADFPGGTVAPVDTYVKGASDEDVRELVTTITAMPGITGATVVDRRGDASLVSVAYAGDRTSHTAHALVRAIRALPTAPGVELLVGGRTALDIDRLDSPDRCAPSPAIRHSRSRRTPDLRVQLAGRGGRGEIDEILDRRRTFLAASLIRSKSILAGPFGITSP